MSVIKKELEYLIKKWDPEYIYFASDTFLSITDAEFEEFIGFYKNIKLPFWIQTRAEVITDYKMQKLKEVGCHRMSIGLEHGNEEFRRNTLWKYFKNDIMVKASEMVARAGIPLTINNIIGFPGETRELIFDTIALNRRLTFDTANACVFAPFHGTVLYDVCKEKGYMPEDYRLGSINTTIALNMPQLSKDEIKGLQRTFALYARMGEEYWPQIKKAEKFDEEGNMAFTELSEIYKNKYFGVGCDKDED